MTNRQTLICLYNAGVAAVSGEASVIRAMQGEKNFKPDLIAAVGKAASGMCLGALSVYGRQTPALVATKYQHIDVELRNHAHIKLIEAGHPIADENSLLAGTALLDAVLSLPADSALLLLVSGGASAIVEKLPPEMSLADWQKLNKEMIASGMNIGQINQQRKHLSLIKDGRLLEHFSGKRLVCCAISDVEGDDISTIGSGIGAVNRNHSIHEVKLVASNQIARAAVAAEAASMGRVVKGNAETLYQDVFKLSVELGAFLRQAKRGVYIWGGEPTITLPDNPGNGGRNQSLGLALAKEISGLDNIHVLVAGTDGSDGPSDAAGALVDGRTFRHANDAQQALNAANAGNYLQQIGDRFVTGPTGTNVMDLLIAIVD